MSRNWRQVRIFTSNFSGGWYHEILVEIVLPWLIQHPHTDYFFSKYLVPLGGADDCDTDPAQLAQQPAFLQVTPHQGTLHRSVRIRFVEPVALAPAAGAPAPFVAVPPLPSPKEIGLLNLIDAQPQKFWKSGFLPYEVRNDLGGPRFSQIPVADEDARDSRGELVAAVLQANCQLILNLFSVHANGFIIENSQHVLNTVLQTPVQSVAHMMANVGFDANGETAEIWAIDQKRHFGAKV